MSVASVIPDKLKKLFGVSTDSGDAGMMPGLDDTSPLAQTRQMDAAAPESNAILAALKGPVDIKALTDPNNPALANLEKTNPAVRAAALGSSVPPKLAAAAAPQKLSLPSVDGDAPSPIVPNRLADVAGVQSATPDSSQLPKLAPQGGSNPIPRALLRIMGITAADPKEGQLYNGPVTSDDKLKAGVGFAGRLGNALAAAAGTPQQQEIAEKRSEFGPELAQKKALTEAQIQSLGDYRQGRLKNAADTNDINQQKADQANQIAVGKMALKGQVPMEGEPGVFRPMTPEEVLAHPVLSQDVELKKSAQMAHDAKAALDGVNAQTALTGDTEAGRLAREKLAVTKALAERQLDLKLAQLHNSNARVSQTDERIRIVEEKMLQDYGLNARGQVQNRENAAPFSATDDQGNPVPNKQATAFRPTTAARGKGEQARTIMDAGEKLVQHIKDHANEIGPLASRYNDVLSFIGNPPPQYKGLAAELESWIALHPAAHGFRGMNAVQEFQKAFGPIAMTPEALIAGIRGSYNTMGALENTAKPRTTGPAGGGAPSKPAASNGSKLYLFPDGKKRPVAPNMVREAIADGAREAQ